ncbi:MAG: SDR family NAD(P)-dependent oxidoreductase, partial [Pseudomonadota bacterium]
MKRVLITAGGSGIGRAMAAGFDAAGYDVWVTDVDQAALDHCPKHWTCHAVSVTDE